MHKKYLANIRSLRWELCLHVQPAKSRGAGSGDPLVYPRTRHRPSTALSRSRGTAGPFPTGL